MSHHAIARWFASRGVKVFPLAPGGKLPLANCHRCSERDPEYIPHAVDECRCLAAGRTCHGVRAATTDLGLIDAWWGADGRRGVGIAAGPSGLLIVDLDAHHNEVPEADRILPGVSLPADLDPSTVHNGVDVLALLCEVRDEPLLVAHPPTLTVRTPSGGMHLYYRVTDGFAWKPNTNGALGWQVDVRAAHSYGVAPGVTVDAGTYTALGDCRAIAPLPGWLGAELDRVGLYRRPQPVHAPRPHTAPKLGDGRRYVEKAVESELDAVATCRAGRSDQLTRSAYSIGQLVGAGLVAMHDAHQALTDAAAAAGISPDERKAQSTITRSLTAGAANPRNLTGVSR